MGVATSPEAPKEAEDDMSGQALAVDIALKFIVRRSRTLLSDGSWEIHTDERTGEYIGILREIHKDVTQRHSIADSHAALSESDMTECYRLVEEHAKPLHEGKGHNENQESRQAFRAWMHTTYGGNWPIDLTVRLGGITDGCIRHLNNVVRDRITKITEDRIRHSVPANTGKVANSKVVE